MFYSEQKNGKFFIKSDETNGEYGPFEGIFCKNIASGTFFHTIDWQSFPAHRYAIGFTKKRIFFLENNGNITILTPKNYE